MAKVLIVEDDIDLRETYTDVLEGEGHSTFTAGSASEALQMLYKTVPDVVLLDMQLPGGSGMLVLSFIRQLRRLSRTKVVVASGHANLAKQAMEQWGADLFLAKPISNSDLKGTVQKLTVAGQPA